MENEQAYEEVPSGRTFLERAKESGPIGLAGLGGVLFTFVLLACSVYLAKTRKQLFVVIAAAIGVGLGGYFAYDRTYITLNLSMQDAESVRADCRALMQRWKSTAATSVGYLHLSGSALPASFVRLGAKEAAVTKTGVRICLYSDGNGGEWGFLYAPQRPDAEPERFWEVRPTWYRDFYEFRVLGE